MHAHFGAALAAAVALGLPAAGEDFRWQGRLAPGQTLEVKGVNGDVAAGPAAGDQAELLAVKRGRRSDPAEVEIKVVEHADGVTICAVYPSGSGRGPNECAPGEGGRMNTRDNDVQVDFTVKVPKGVRFVGRTVNGELDAESLTGDVDARTVNGSVSVSTAGHALAKTVNGSITARMGRADWTGSADYKTVNGTITLELPGDLSAQVLAKTVNGSIETDFPLTVKGKLSRRSIEGTIGAGGRELQLETVNGSIRLRRAP